MQILSMTASAILREALAPSDLQSNAFDSLQHIRLSQTYRKADFRVLLPLRRHKIGGRGIAMRYRKISVELIVVADEADAVVGELNAALDRLDEIHTLFGGEIETVAFEHRGKQGRSALAHTIAAGETVTGAIKTAHHGMKAVLRAVI